MTAAGIARNLRLLASRPTVFLGRREYVLILSHMRSYSSLLAHLLGSHPEIAGYAEMHVSYTRRRDLLALRAEVARSLDGHVDGRLVLDKVLHDHYPVRSPVLDDPAVHPIFLVRRPAETLRSILRMNERLPDMVLYPGQEEATKYYVDRLASLERLARDRKGGALVLRSELLVAEPEATLARLARFLRLETPIETTYSTFPLSGVPGRGDFSEAIRQGSVQPRENASPPAELDPELLDAAERVHAGCLETLESLFGTAD